jgi:hypothetical protein
MAITSLVQSGSDAFTNLFDVEIEFPTDVITDGDTDKLSHSVRVVDFTPPELKPSVYKVSYKGIEIQKIGPKIEGDRTFSIQYRIDANWELHMKLLKWKNLYANPNAEGNINFNAIYGTDVLSSTATPRFGVVRVYVYSGLTKNLLDFGNQISKSNGSVGFWAFWGVACLEAGTPAFAREGGDPAKATAKFMFLEYSDLADSTSVTGTPVIASGSP